MTERRTEHPAPTAAPPAGDGRPRVVVGIDGSAGARSALRLWTDLSSTAPPTPADIRARVREEADRLVTRIAEEQGPGGDPVPHLHVTLVEGIAREAVLERAAEPAGADR